MFRKIPSNRNPRDTLFSELRKEFAVYWGWVIRSFTRAVERRPQMSLAAMILLILLSVALSIYTFRHPKVPRRRLVSKDNITNKGFDQLFITGTAIQGTRTLKAGIDSLIAKKALSKLDSESLVNKLHALQQLNKYYRP